MLIKKIFLIEINAVTSKQHLRETFPPTPSDRRKCVYSDIILTYIQIKNAMAIHAASDIVSTYMKMYSKIVNPCQMLIKGFCIFTKIRVAQLIKDVIR